MKTAVKIYRTVIFLLIVAALIGIGFLWHKPLEAPIIITAFLIAKQKYKFKYHCNSAVKCLCLSIGVFSVAISFTLPVGVSYAFAGVCGVGIAYIAQYVAELKFIQKDYEYIEPRYNDLLSERQKANVYGMDEMELRTYCKRNFLDDIDEEIVIQRIIYHLRGQALYDKIGYSKSQMIRREKRIEQQLKISLKN